MFNSNNRRIATRTIASMFSNHTTNTTTTTTLRYPMMLSNNNNNSNRSFHVDVKNSDHFVMTEEKRVFLEALKHELFGSSNVVATSSMISTANRKQESQRSYSQSSSANNGSSSRVQSVVADKSFDKSLENSRNLMCHKRHDVLTQQQSQYFLYL